MNYTAHVDILDPGSPTFTIKRTIFEPQPGQKINNEKKIVATLKCAIYAYLHSHSFISTIKKTWKYLEGTKRIITFFKKIMTINI